MKHTIALLICLRELSTLGACLPGDFDLDGDVDGRDMLVWQREVGKVISNADSNLDFTVDGKDLELWRANYGKKEVCPPRPTTLTSSIDSMISKAGAPTAGNLVVFQSYSASGCNLDLAAVWNVAAWPYGVNLSPIAWHDNSRKKNKDGTWGCGPTLGRGIAITRRHLLSHHQHAPENPSTSVQFLRANGEVLTRKLAAEYEVTSDQMFRVLWMDADLPEDMVAAIPSMDSVTQNKPIVALNQDHELRLQYTYNQGTSIAVNGIPDPDPKRRAYFKAPRSGDSGKPLFAIIGRQMIPLSFWWTVQGGSSIAWSQGAIMAAVNRLSATKKDSRNLQPSFVQVK